MFPVDRVLDFTLVRWTSSLHHASQGAFDASIIPVNCNCLIHQSLGQRDQFAGEGEPGKPHARGRRQTTAEAACLDDLPDSLVRLLQISREFVTHLRDVLSPFVPDELGDDNLESIGIRSQDVGRFPERPRLRWAFAGGAPDDVEKVAGVQAQNRLLALGNRFEDRTHESPRSSSYSARSESPFS